MHITTMKILVLLVVALLVLSETGLSAQELACKNKRFVSDDHVICACDATSCADLSVNLPTQPKSALLVQSTKAGLRFATSGLKEKGLDNSLIHLDDHIRLTVDPAIQHQSILGWGGAFTDAAGINIRKLSEQTANLLLEIYFGRNGLQYNFGRVPIGGTDFSTHAYTYDDTKEPDLALTNWTLTNEDFEYKIPIIKRAMAIAAEKGTKLKLFASPWSPPAWMKENGKLVRGHLKKDHKIYSSYARYIVKFYEAYQKQGIKFWGGTVQNEPFFPQVNPAYSFNSLEMDNDEMKAFIGDYLGPALEANGFTRENFKLMIGDDSLGFINLQVPTVIEDPKVRRYVSGLAFHWYLSGPLTSYDLLNAAFDSGEGSFEFSLMTEACNGFLTHTVDLGDWDRGEKYAVDIIETLSHGTSGWIDWNLALNLQGGPNWAKNYVDSPVIVDSAKGRFYLQPMYYALAHFTRFFKPGSVRVSAILGSFDEVIKAVAVYNKETGHLIINILNSSEDQKTIDVIISGEYGLESFLVDAKSINTVVLKL